MNIKTKSFFLSIILGVCTPPSFAFSSNCLGDCPITPSNNFEIEHNVFAASINPETKFADWVAYIVKHEYFDGGPSRNRSWREDTDIPYGYRLSPYCEGRRSDRSCDDYRNAFADYTYERGHLAPLGSFKAHPDWRRTNYYSNIAPQLRKLNNGPWKKLEEHVRDLARNGKSVYVLTGSLYNGVDMHELPESDDAHEVPTDYWKIVAIREAHTLKVAAFIFNQDATSRDHCDYASTISEIEAHSGLDIFPSNQRQLTSLMSEVDC